LHAGPKSSELYVEGDTGFRQFQEAIQAMIEAAAP
jgi:hypothetical protein